MKDIQECNRFFITLDSDNWNSHCESFEKNWNSMTNFEGDVVEDKRNANYQNGY